MTRLIHVSDAANLALHALMLLGRGGGGHSLSVAVMADELAVSEPHLGKVLQRLAKLGLVTSRRGPAGGFTLGRPSNQIRLMEILEAIEGPVEQQRCLLGRNLCVGKACAMGTLVHSVQSILIDHLTKTLLSDVAFDA